MSDQLFIIISAGLFGLVIGALIMYFVSAKSADSAKSVKIVEDKLNKYQEDVVQHFEQTADLVDELTQSYKKVFDHLGKSARELLTEEQVQQQIEKRAGKKVTLGYLVEENEESDNSEVFDQQQKEETQQEPQETAEENVSEYAEHEVLNKSELLEETSDDAEEIVEETEVIDEVIDEISEEKIKAETEEK